MRHSAVRLWQVRRWKPEAIEVKRLFSAHPVNKHGSLVKRKIVFIARVEFPSKCNLIFLGTGDADAILLSIDDYFSTIVTRPGILELRMKWLIFVKGNSNEQSIQTTTGSREVNFQSTLKNSCPSTPDRVRFQFPTQFHRNISQTTQVEFVNSFQFVTSGDCGRTFS